VCVCVFVYVCVYVEACCYDSIRCFANVELGKMPRHGFGLVT